MAARKTKNTAAPTVEEIITDAEIDAIAIDDTPIMSIEPEQPMTLQQLMMQVPDSDADVMNHAIADALDERADREAKKNPDNTSIQSTIKKLRKQVGRRATGRLFVAAQRSPDFMNRQLREGAAYNVYAIGKLGDLVAGLVGDETKNAVNRAILASLFKIESAGLSFDMETAKMCVSQNYTPKPDQSDVASRARSHLVRHTMSPSTAPTQASSTVQALETLGIVVKDGGRNPTIKLLDNALTRALRATWGALSAV
ncbi:hypothetical protein F1188_16195 [Roseospira marina]|uniref:Uncharacterized protein n=1 Tax=Roseospira marina TaxID=140057 RepID=A0A5M6I823_9PROT|nr:hypothetical protein [Roseospira marina]KAA5604400.1 hypothetical protein F1188_16195 [Roseospira marina]MBB4315408.1 hypothetical protein [Roseospira marina]MBB5088447.1 hypothetical protein [Roseospira marina]